MWLTTESKTCLTEDEFLIDGGGLCVLHGRGL
jgi:hypothetical protein